MVRATATELKNNFGKYLQMVQDGKDVIVLRNGKEVARLISNENAITYMTDSLVGVLKKDINEKEIRKERLLKYESIN